MISHVATSSPVIRILSDDMNLRMRIVSRTTARPDQDGVLTMPCPDINTHEHAVLLSELRDLGLAFAEGVGWSPAETLAYYVEDKRWITGDYDVVAEGGADGTRETRHGPVVAS